MLPTVVKTANPYGGLPTWPAGAGAGPGVPSWAMLKKILHWAIAAAVVLHLFALLVRGQAFLPGF